MNTWKIKILLAIIFPSVLLCVMEFGLRLLDVGYPTSLLVDGVVEGEPVWVTHPFFSYQVFPPPLARTPTPIVIKKNKAPDAFRVVVLGESAAQGDPIPDFGPPRLLEYVLRHVDPLSKVEVINAAMTAINSHVILEIARDLEKMQPDLVILYVGNNEVIGPYGPGTVFTRFLDSDRMIAWAMWANRLRITQAIRLTMAAISDRRQKKDFGGVAMFMDKPVAHDDERLVSVRRRYENNLQQLIRDARKVGAEVLLSTVAVNLADCPPSISLHRQPFPEADARRWQQFFDQGRELAKQKAWAEALPHFRDALALDDQHAELHYWIGMCEQGLHRPDVAMASFEQALEFDAFRYRTDATMNDQLRRLAASTVPAITLVDAAAIFREQAIGGNTDLFVDHVHFTFAGASLLARTWAEKILAMKSWPTLVGRGALPDTTWLREEVLYSSIAEISVLQEMQRRFSKPPFTIQVDSAARVEQLGHRIKELNNQLRIIPHQQMADTLRDRVMRYPDDLFFEMHLAQLLVSFHRYREAQVVAATAMARHPHRRGPRATLAHLLAMQGMPEDAAATAYGWARKQGFFAATSASSLFKLLVAGGYLDEAVAVGRAMEQIVRPIDYRWRIRAELERVTWIRDRMTVARQAIEFGQFAVAEEALTAVLRGNPDLGEALFLLAWVQVKKNHPAQGFQMVQQALKSMNFTRAAYYGGLWQAKAGSVDEAVDMFRQSARHAQDDLPVINSLAWICAADRREGLRDPATALALLASHVAETNPPPPAYLLDTYSAVLAANGDYDAAIVASDRAIVAAKSEKNEALIREIRDHRTLYEQQKTARWGRHNRPRDYF